MEIAELLIYGLGQAFVGVLLDAPTPKIALAQKVLCVIASASALGFIVGATFAFFFPNLPGLTVIGVSLCLMIVAALGGYFVEKQVRFHHDNKTDDKKSN